MHEACDFLSLAILTPQTCVLTSATAHYAGLFMLHLIRIFHNYSLSLYLQYYNDWLLLPTTPPEAILPVSTFIVQQVTPMHQHAFLLPSQCMGCEGLEPMEFSMGST